MAERVVVMETRLAAALARWVAGEKLNVTRTAAGLGISRQAFYKYRDRFAGAGIEGLLPRSRRPHSCPRQTPAVVEDEIVRLRKRLAEDGWDNGAVSIWWAMTDAGWDPPHPVTIHRVLRRRGLVVDQPQKRPKSADRRFEFPTSNACWQIDAFDWDLADGSPGVVFQLEDDHSRLEADSYAAASETAEAAWECWLRAVERYGVPRYLLADNHTAYSGKRRGWIGDFERKVEAMGTTIITSSPYHPQTCGKNERIHQTLQRWLRARPRAASLAELQAQLDAWREPYNGRHHQGIDGQRPADRFAASPPATPAEGEHAPPPARLTRPLAAEGGKISVDGHIICLGAQYSHTRLTAIRNGDHVAILHDRHLIRELDLDRSHRYQPSGTKPGGKHRPRLQATPAHPSIHANPDAAPEDVTVESPQRSEENRP